jgi:hypothetical protein
MVIAEGVCFVGGARDGGDTHGGDLG